MGEYKPHVGIDPYLLTSLASHQLPAHQPQLYLELSARMLRVKLKPGALKILHSIRLPIRLADLLDLLGQWIAKVRDTIIRPPVCRYLA